MDFTFAYDTVLIFIFILVPGIAFRRFYFQGEFTKQYNSKTLPHSILASVIPGIIVQFITLLWYSSYSDLSGFILGLSNLVKNLGDGEINELLFNSELILSLIVYLGMMFFVSLGFAHACWKFVRLTKTDRRSKIFRFRNHWNYYLKGEIQGFKEYSELIGNKRIVGVFADVLVRIENEAPRLYSGKLAQYSINTAHELKYIYLTGASIWKKKNPNIKKEQIGILGDIMVISASDVININIRYVKTEKENLKKKYFTPFRKVVSFGALISILTVLFGGFEYLKSNSILSSIFLHFYIILLIVLIAALLRNVFDINNIHRKSLVFSKIVIIAILLIIYWAMKYVVMIF